MIDITKRYLELEETGRELTPYEDFYSCVRHAFDLSQIKSIVDVGCSDGHLLYYLSINNPDINIEGIEYFDYHLKYANEKIVDKIKILDIRIPFEDDGRQKKHDIVVCTEVGEHIDPSCCNDFMKNLKSMTGKFLIMTWSSHGGENEPHNDPHHQHLNPLNFQDYVNIVQSHGYNIDEKRTHLMHEKAITCKNFFSWWKESLLVWSL